jgi:hypothetical protein
MNLLAVFIECIGIYSARLIDGAVEKKCGRNGKLNERRFGIKPNTEQKEKNIRASVIMDILSSLTFTCYINMDILLQYRILLTNYARIASHY